MAYRAQFSIKDWHANRSLGYPSKIASEQFTASQMNPYLCQNMKITNMWNPRDTVNHSDHGGVFNFDFSPDGCVLVAACERRSILMFDPLGAKLISHKLNAHNDCVNCVRFLDNRVFATCSDDTNIALWDARYLKRNICLLQGHSNWVKNIEYSRETGQLVTSGFDGSIYSWDINSYHSCESKPERLFRSSGLIRTKLSPDSSKMIISTSAGYLMIIHDLDLSTLAHDLVGFKPDIFRLMQLTKSSQRLGVNYRELFTRPKNRVEFISDFPPDDDAEVVSSLQVHPHGWCTLSRNTSSDERTEWSCVHDIQSRYRPNDDDDYDDDERAEAAPSTSDPDAQTYTHSINSVGAALMFSIMASPPSPGRDTTSMESDSDIINALRGIRTAEVIVPNPAVLPPSASFTNDNTVITESVDDLELGDDSELYESADDDLTGHAIDLDDLNPHTDLDDLGAERMTDMDFVDTHTNMNRESVNTPNANVNTQPNANVNAQPNANVTARPNANVSAQTNTNVNTVNNQRSANVNTTVNQSTNIVTEQTNASIINNVNTNSSAWDVNINQTNTDLRTRTINSINCTNDNLLNSLSENANHPTSELSFDASNTTSMDYESNSNPTQSPIQISHSSPVQITNSSDTSPNLQTNTDIIMSNPDDNRRVTRSRTLARRSLNHDTSTTSTNSTTNSVNTNSTTTSATTNTATNSGAYNRETGDNSRINNQNRNSNRDSNASSESQQTGSSGSGSRSTPSDPTTAARTREYPPHRIVTFRLQLDSNHRNLPGIERARMARTLSRTVYLSGFGYGSPNKESIVRIHDNVPRLLSYTDEANSGRGFIKEPCFSTDGRIICSPFGFGVRLLAFNPACDELCDCVPVTPRKLYEIGCNMGHSNAVVTTKFSPVHNLLVSGCLDGKVAFHQPLF